MPTPKLFCQKAANANVAVILRRGTSRTEWELIRWDMNTDTFTPGQWLRGKQMNGTYQAISPDGTLFAYHYSCAAGAHGVVSAIPNMTALYFNDKWWGGQMIAFDNENRIVSPKDMRKVGSVDIEIIKKGGIDRGYMGDSWTDSKGRNISTEGGKLLANGEVIQDTTDHVFTARAPM